MQCSRYIFKLSSIRVNPELILEKPGIYVWSFSPNISCDSPESFMNSINEFANKRFSLDRSDKVWQHQIILERRPFSNNGGLVLSETKLNEVQERASDLSFRMCFSEIISSVCQDTQVLYIGKAKNLRTRLEDHLNERGSRLLSDLKDANITDDELRIRVVYDSSEVLVYPTDLSSSCEELLQRILNPGFVRRYG